MHVDSAHPPVNKALDRGTAINQSTPLAPKRAIHAEDRVHPS